MRNKISSLLPAFALFCSACCIGQKNDTAIEKFLSGRHNFDTAIDTTAYPFIIRRLDVTAYSLLVDGKEMIGAADQGSPATDSVLYRLLAFEPIEISRIKNSGTTEYYKLIKTDTVASIRYASIGMPLSHNVDSVLSLINHQLQNGTSWNDLPYHFTDTYQPVKGGRGWIRASLLKNTFIEQFIQHKKGSVFLVKDNDLQYAWIIYKTDDEQMFERRQFIFAADREH